MNSDDINYRSLSPGCFVDVQAEPPDQMEGRIIRSGKTKRRPSAGIVVESHSAFPVGGHVFIDLKFPGHINTYRSRGIVSWVVETEKESHPFKMGVLIFGMDKLDEHGVSVSVAAKSPIPDVPDSTTMPAPPPRVPVGTKSTDAALSKRSPMDSNEDDLSRTLPVAPRTNKNLDSWESLIGEDFVEDSDDKTLPTRDPDPISVAPAGNDTSIPVDLISLCAANERIDRWLSPVFESAEDDAGDQPLDPDAFGSDMATTDTLFLPPGTQEELLSSNVKASLKLTDEDINDLPLFGSDEERIAVSDAPPDPAFVAIAEQERANIPTSELIDVDLCMEDDFDAEEKMIDAFERIHTLYQENNRDGVAKRALALAKDLVVCEAGRILLNAEEKFELCVVSKINLPDSFDNAMRPFIGGATGVAIQTGAAILVTDPKTDKNYQSTLDDISEFETKNMISAPIQHHGHTVGAIELRNSPRKGGFLLGEANLVFYIARAMAEFMHTSVPQSGFRPSEFR